MGVGARCTASVESLEPMELWKVCPFGCSGRSKHGQLPANRIRERQADTKSFVILEENGKAWLQSETMAADS
jgi:hypothetical protein